MVRLARATSATAGVCTTGAAISGDSSVGRRVAGLTTVQGTSATRTTSAAGGCSTAAATTATSSASPLAPTTTTTSPSPVVVVSVHIHHHTGSTGATVLVSN